MEPANRRMMWHGMVLFLIGLLTGFFEARFKNVRMGLAAHLVGVTNGTFLIALGAVWTNVELPPRAKAAAHWTALYGSYGNWLFSTLGATFGTGALSPITAPDHRGKPWQENLEKAGFLSVAVSITVASMLVVWGLGRKLSSPAQPVNPDGPSDRANHDMPLTPYGVDGL
jgi:(hydroxyamino)benzene mutase